MTTGLLEALDIWVLVGVRVGVLEKIHEKKLDLILDVLWQTVDLWSNTIAMNYPFPHIQSLFKGKWYGSDVP